MDLTKQIALFLDEKGFGSFDENGTSGNIFINTIPDQPHESIGIYSTGGPGADPGGSHIRASIQLLIRSKPYDPRIEGNVQSIINSLNGFNSDVLVDGGSWIFDITAQQSAPSNIGADENHRFEFSQNFIIEYVK